MFLLKAQVTTTRAWCQYTVFTPGNTTYFNRLTQYADFLCDFIPYFVKI